MHIADLAGTTIGGAVSGGLDSCVITQWLADRGVRVFCFTADLCQPDEENIEAVRERMLACGATEAIIVPAKDKLARAGLSVIQSQARYEGGYWNTTGIARYVTVEAILPELKKRGLSAFFHGATGRGNDQVRFELAARMLAPKISVYAPWRDPAFLEQFGGRKEMLEFCAVHALPVKATLQKPYSTDANMLGLTHEGGDLESLLTPAMRVEPVMGVHAERAPRDGENVTVEFVRGVPRAINGTKLALAELFLLANAIAGKHGIGIGTHVVENRFVGIKSRGVYEAPGMELLGMTYELLLQLVLDRRARRLFQTLALFLGEQIYQGYWYDRGTRAALKAVEALAQLVTGSLSVRLHRGNVTFLSAQRVPHALYEETAASMEKTAGFDHTTAEGFVKTLGVHAAVVGRKQRP